MRLKSGSTAIPQSLLIIGLGLANGFDRDIFLAKGARCVIFEPIFDTALMKVVLNVAGQGHYALLYIELTQADATFVLVGHRLRTPVDLEHLL